MYTLAKYPHMFRGAIVENTFTSISDMVDIVFPFLKFVKWMILNNYWASIDLVSRLECPLLFVSGSLDELVPYEMTEKLHQSAVTSAYKELYIVEDGTHNDTWHRGGREYIARLKQFIEKSMTIERRQNRVPAERDQKKDESEF